MPVVKYKSYRGSYHVVLAHWFGIPLLISSRVQTGEAITTERMAQSDRVLCLNLALVPNSWQVSIFPCRQPAATCSNLTNNGGKFTLCQVHILTLKACDNWRKYNNLRVNPGACIQLRSQVRQTIFILNAEPLGVSCQSDTQPVSNKWLWPNAFKPFVPIAFEVRSDDGLMGFGQHNPVVLIWTSLHELQKATTESNDNARNSLFSLTTRVKHLSNTGVEHS